MKPEILFILLAAGANARASDQLYGSEITVTNRKVYHADYGEAGREYYGSPENTAAMEAIARETARICGGGCAVVPKTERGNKYYEVTFRDGWRYQITLDPYCIEFKLAPYTLAGHRRERDRMQKYIIDISRSQGLELGFGGGHIHMGFHPHFSADPKFLAKWLADYANHLLAAGVMAHDNYSKYNAMPIARLAPEKRRRFAEIIDAAYSGQIKSSTELAERIVTEVYSDPSRWGDGVMDDNVKYHEIQLFRVVDPRLPERYRTIEMRALRNMTIDQMLSVMELFERRMEFIRRKGPIRYIDYGSRLPPMEERAGMFRRYVLDVGLNPKDFEFLLDHGRWRRLVVPPPTIAERPRWW